MILLLKPSFLGPPVHAHRPSPIMDTKTVDGLVPVVQDDAASSSQVKAAAARRISQLVLDILSEYSLNKWVDSKDRLAAGAEKFMDVIDQFILAEKRVEACLPAFPFKSANKVYKVLGHLPDKAEELALDRLNTICKRIQLIYAPGARITIISDGITYNGKFLSLIFLTEWPTAKTSYYQTYCPFQIVIHGHMAKHCEKWPSKRASTTLPLPE